MPKKYKYNRKLTENNAIVSKYDFLTTFDKIINEASKGVSISKYCLPIIDGDALEIKIASEERRNPNCSMDFLHFVSDKNNNYLILVECKLNVINPLRPSDIKMVEKINGTRLITEHFNYCLFNKAIFLFSDGIVSEAKNRVDRILKSRLLSIHPISIKVMSVSQYENEFLY